MRYKNLKKDILIWFGVILVLILFIFSLGLNYFFTLNFRNNIKNYLIDEANQAHKKLLNNQKIDKNYQILKGTFKSKFYIIDKGEYLNSYYLLSINKPFKGAIKITKNHINDISEDLRDSMLFLEPILFLVLIFLANNLIDKIIIPIKTISLLSKQTSIKKLPKPLHIKTKYIEIKELIISFNEMIDRLRQGIEKIDRFNSDVSHELRTPITAIKGEIEVILMKKRDNKTYQNSLQKVETEIDKIYQIIENLLLLSAENISFENVNINNLVLNVIEKYQFIEIKNFENAEVKGNYQLLQIMLNNLIDNSIKYSQNPKIELNLTKYFIEIKDNGIGISQKNLNKVMDRFFRVDTSRNREGFGLGLSIVKNIIELHNFRFYISSKLGEGTIIKIEF